MTSQTDYNQKIFVCNVNEDLLFKYCHGAINHICSYLKNYNVVLNFIQISIFPICVKNCKVTL